MGDLFGRNLDLPRVQAINRRVRKRSRQRAFQGVRFARYTTHGELQDPRGRNARHIFHFHRLLLRVRRENFNVRSKDFYLIRNHAINLSNPRRNLRAACVLLPTFCHFHDCNCLLIRRRRHMVALNRHNGGLYLCCLAVYLALLRYHALSPFNINRLSGGVRFPANEDSRQVNLNEFATIGATRDTFRIRLDEERMDLLND